MNDRKIAKNILWVIAGIAAGFVVVCLGFFVHLSKPYIIEIEEVRATGKLETVRVYWGRACGEDFLSEETSGARLTLAVPEGGITPAETRASVPGNLFIITGYRFKSVQKNLLNGDVTETPGQRFDALKWHVVPPYEAYVDDKDAFIKTVSTPLGWQSDAIKAKFIFNKRSETDGC